MKAAVLTEPEKVAIREIQKPRIGPGEALIKVKSCGICTTDRRWYKGDGKITFPAILGHEVAGVVEEVRGNNPNVEVGETVVGGGIFGHSCGNCRYCKQGLENHCPNLNITSLDTGELLSLGGFSQYYLSPLKGIFPVKRDISFEEASFAEPLSCVIHSFNQGKVIPGDRVIIIGSGPMGLLHLLWAKFQGCQTIVTDIDEQRLELARELGADSVLSPSSKDFQKTVEKMFQEISAKIFVTAGSKNAIEQGLDLAGKRSSVVLYGSLHPPQKIELDSEIHYSETTVTGSKSQLPREFQRAVDILTHRSIDVRPLISKQIPLESIQQGFETKPKGKIQRILVKL